MSVEAEDPAGRVLSVRSAVQPDGVYVLDRLTPGRYRVRLGGSAYSGAVDDAPSTEVEACVFGHAVVTAGASIRLDLAVPPHPHLRVRMRCSSTPLPGAVHLLLLLGDHPCLTRDEMAALGPLDLVTQRHVLAHPRGEPVTLVRFHDVPPGAYTLVASAHWREGDAGVSSRHSVVVTATPQEQETTFELPNRP